MTRREASARVSRERLSLLAVATDDSRVGSWKVEILTFVAVPPHEVGRLPVLMTNLENNAVTIGLARPTSANHYSVTNLCDHDAPYLQTLYSMPISSAVTPPGTEVPQVWLGHRPRSGGRALESGWTCQVRWRRS